MKLIVVLGMALVACGVNSRDIIPGEEEELSPHFPAEFSFRKGTPSCEDLADSTVKSYKYNDYFTFSQIEDWLKYMACKHSSLVQLSVIGHSVEQRPIYMLTIAQSSFMRSPGSFVPVDSSFKIGAVDTQKSTVDNLRYGANKKIIFIDGGIHAREWAAPHAAMKITEEVIRNPSASHLDVLEWKIVPLVNPDGYEYSRTTDRMWRKNRAILPQSNCVGVDLNRNFDIHWSETVKKKCSIQYGGPSPFSEPEARALRDAINEDRNRVKGYITLHSYGELILYPFGYTKFKKPRTLNQLKAMGTAMSQAIRRKTSTNYKVEQASFLGAAAGGSDDWAYLAANVDFSYTLELKPNFNRRNILRFSGFELSKSKLGQAVEEAWIAAETMAKRIARSSQLKSPSLMEEGPPREAVNKPGLIGKLEESFKEGPPAHSSLLEGETDHQKDAICYDRNGKTFLCPRMPSLEAHLQAPAK